MFPHVLLHSGIYILLGTVCLVGLALYNPRLMLGDYPPAIQAAVPPRTEAEKRQALLLGLPFLLVLIFYPFLAAFLFISRIAGQAGFFTLWLYAFLVIFAFNLWDWLVLDGL